MAIDNREIVRDFAEIFFHERDVRRAFEKYVVEDYIQHNPTIALVQLVNQNSHWDRPANCSLIAGLMATDRVTQNPEQTIPLLQQK
jgi:hypothetical protein